MMKDSSLRNVGIPWSAAAFALLTVPVLGQAAQAQVPLRLNQSRPVQTRAIGTDTQALSPQVKAQIEILQQEKMSRTPAQRKLTSQLVFASRIDRGQPAVAGVPSLRAPKLERDMLGRVLVDIKGNITPGLQQAVVSMGGAIVTAYPQWNTMRAWVGSAWFELLAQRNEVRIIRQGDKGYRRGVGGINTQGDAAHGAASVRNLYGATGYNSKVGVISDSELYLDNSIASGDLPNTVSILQSGLSEPNTLGEGTAMMEIVHDLAPAAELAFASAVFGDAAFAQSILDLAAAGCDIIVDDIGYFFESPFQDDIIADAVDQVTALGVYYFSAAGNERNSAWEGDFKNGGAGTGVMAGAGTVHRFPSNRLYDTPDYYTTAILGWADPIGASDNDYDLYDLDAAGTTIFDASTGFQTGTQDPVESLFAFPGERLVVVKWLGADRALRLYAAPDYGANLTEFTTGSTFGHSGANGTFGIAASDATLAAPNLFSLTSVTESFSSTGPRRVFYRADGSAITPGNFLFATNGGELRQKPSFTAADGVSTTVPGFDPFYGTSAAAPHAAAMTAQLRSLAYFNLTPTSQSYVDGVNLWRDEVVSAFTNTALDLETAGWDANAGAGMMMINRAAGSLVNFLGNLTVTPAADSVLISWTTSVPASSFVQVGLGANDPNPITVDDPTLTTTHIVAISGLGTDVLYNYNVESGSGSSAVYGKNTGTFQTFFLDQVSVTGIGPNQATVKWRTGLPANSVLTISRSATDPNPIVITDPSLLTNHSITVTGLEEETQYIYKLSSQTPSGIYGERTGTFKTGVLQEVIAIKAVLLNKAANPWQVEVTLKNQSKFSTAKNVKIDSMIFNANNTKTLLPATLPDIAPNSTVTRIFTFNKLAIGSVVNARVTGSYTTPRAAKRFSGTILAEIK
jgi:Subtilase family